MVHFAVVFLVATLFRCLLEFYYKKKRVVLEWGVYLKQVFPTGKIFENSCFYSFFPLKIY